MTIGIDGNEANVKNRVGSGQYAFELLKQFAKVANYSSSERSEREVTSKNIIDSRVSSRQARTIQSFSIYLKGQPLQDLPKKSENFKYKVFGPKMLWTQFTLPVRLSVGKKPDVFFSMAHYGPRFSKVPYVVTIHDLSYLHFPQMFKKDDLYQLTNWTKYSIKNSAHIIAVSQTTKEDIVKNYDINPAKITVTYEGYDKDRFKPQSKSAIDRVKKKYGIKGDYIIFVGTLQPRKNLERLIQAFEQVIRSSKFARPASLSEAGEVRSFQLVIAGKKGWLYESIFEKVKALNLQNKVIFTDYVPDDDLPALIAGAKVYVLPSLWEGFGIPVIEAQACGVPVVISNTSSLPEITGAKTTSEVKLGRNQENTSEVNSVDGSAILVDPENVDSIATGIKKALDPKVRASLISRGRGNISRFSWGKCAQETLKVLRQTALGTLK